MQIHAWLWRFPWKTDDSMEKAPQKPTLAGTQREDRGGSAARSSLPRRPFYGSSCFVPLLKRLRDQSTFAKKRVDRLNTTHNLVVVWKRDPGCLFPSFLSFAKVMQCTEYSKIWLHLTFAALSLTFIRGHKASLVFWRGTGGWKGYGRREKKGREAGEKFKEASFR